MAIRRELVRSNLVNRNHFVLEPERIKFRKLVAQAVGELGDQQERVRRHRD